MTVQIDPNTNKMTFWFDVDKKRDNSGKLLAQARVERMTGESFAKIKKKSGNGSWHHLDNDRSNGHHLNLFWTTSEEQHNNLHNQLHEFASVAIKTGILGFDYGTKKYYTADPAVETHIKKWLHAGQPNWHVADNYKELAPELIRKKSPVQGELGFN
jgi:hypothetical protein